MIYSKYLDKHILIRFLICIIFFSFNFWGYAETDDKWTLGAVEFTYSQDGKRTEYEKAVLKTVPQLILEQLYGVGSRNIPDKEILDRKINELVKERLSLFLEISREQKVKDSLILKELSEYQFKKQQSESENKIKDIQKKIDENLEKQSKIFSDFKSEKGDFLPSKKKSEDFSLYKENAAELFVYNGTDGKTDYSSYKFSQEVLNANIKGLITGSITKYGNYAAVSAELLLYPGADSVGVITEVGHINDIETISRNIAYRLAPKIENLIPCEIQIKIKPEELSGKAKLTVDSTVYEKVPEKLIVSKGVHNFNFECDGYKRESFSYGFGYEQKYLIEVEFVELKPDQTALVLKNPLEGNLFYNGIAAEDNVMSVKINNNGVLAYYYTENENTLFFMIPKEQLKDNKSVAVRLTDVDIGKYIEKRRQMMYISYSALICSLPFLFYSYSNLTNLVRGYTTGTTSITFEEMTKYQQMSYISIGITSGLGAWFAVELILYLISANKALPAETKKSNISFDEAVAKYKAEQERLEAERILQEEKQREKEELKAAKKKAREEKDKIKQNPEETEESISESEETVETIEKNEGSLDG